MEKNNTKKSSMLETTVKISRLKRYIQTASSTHIGTRAYQQDALYVTDSIGIDNNNPTICFGILCDGMGGMENGERASQDTVAYLANKITSLKIQDANTQIIPFFLEKEVQLINELIYSIEGENSNKGATGTTLTGVIIYLDHLYWVSVGDSSIYIIRKDEIVKVSREHNYNLTLIEKVKNGHITQYEADANPNKNALISFIGMPYVEIMDINQSPFVLESEDIILLCSDGLTNSLTNVEIFNIIKENKNNLQEAARVLPLYAFDKATNNQDNTSVILIQYI